MSTVSRFTIAAALAAASLAAPRAGAQQTVYAIGNGGSTLIRFQSNTPGSVTVVGSFAGANTFLDAISFRPATGELFGYLDSTDSFYRVNTATGQLTLASTGASAAPTNTFQLGLAFNPTIDRARLVTDSGQNIVFNPNDGTAAGFTGLAYAVGDVNANAGPLVIDNAYTRPFAGATTTTQYVIDYGLDALATLANNTGVLTTVGALGVNTDIYTGFDIFNPGPGGLDTGYAILTPPGAAGVPSFYTINLGTGAATLVGPLGFTNQVYSLAVIPAPGAAVLMGVSAAAGSLRRRRR